MTHRIIFGVVAAGALALAASSGSIAGIAWWKVVMALIGFGLFFLGGRART